MGAFLMPVGYPILGDPLMAANPIDWAGIQRAVSKHESDKGKRKELINQMIGPWLQQAGLSAAGFDTAMRYAADVSPYIEAASPLIDQAASYYAGISPLIDEARGYIAGVSPLIGKGESALGKALSYIGEATPLYKQGVGYVEKASPYIESVTPITQEGIGYIRDVTPLAEQLQQLLLDRMNLGSPYYQERQRQAFEQVARDYDQAAGQLAAQLATQGLAGGGSAAAAVAGLQQARSQSLAQAFLENLFQNENLQMQAAGQLPNVAAMRFNQAAGMRSLGELPLQQAQARMGQAEQMRGLAQIPIQQGTAATGVGQGYADLGRLRLGQADATAGLGQLRAAQGAGFNQLAGTRLNQAQAKTSQADLFNQIARGRGALAASLNPREAVGTIDFGPDAGGSWTDVLNGVGNAIGLGAKVALPFLF